MSTAKESQSEPPDVRTQILQEATRLFAEQGFDGTSIRAISDEVGIAKPSLLYHFPSKDELRRVVLEQVFSHWSDVLPELLKVATSGEGRFESLMTEVLSFFLADTNRAKLLTREMLDRPEEINEQLRKFLSPWMHLTADYIRRGQEEGIIYEDVDADAYILHIIQMVVGGLSTSIVYGGLLEENSSDDATTAEQRQVQEIIRIAHSSLFVGDATPEKG
ncbi:MAG: TetR/AcrR family transcriptional regulator [Myxococcota bacterium]